MAEIKQTERALRVLNDTMKCCKDYRHEFIMPEHLLMVLVDDFNFRIAAVDIGSLVDEERTAVDILHFFFG